MNYYLQIKKVLVAMFLATSPNSWNIQTVATTHLYSNRDTVYVADARWIDTLLSMQPDTTKSYPINYSLDTNCVQIVQLPDSEIIH